MKALDQMPAGRCDVGNLRLLRCFRPQCNTTGRSGTEVQCNRSLAQGVGVAHTSLSPHPGAETGGTLAQLPIHIRNVLLQQALVVADEDLLLQNVG